MPGSPPTIGDAGRERARALGLRRQGVTVIELAEDFEATFAAAWRFAQRMIREGVLVRTELRRRRPEVFGVSWPGKPAVVLRGRRAKEE